MSKLSGWIQAFGNFVGNSLVKLYHIVALFAILGAVVYASAMAFLGMAAKQHFSIEDILLLFIYLELGAMVGIYFKTAKMPVRFLIYVAITAITRMMIGMINTKHEADIGIVIAAGAIFILTVATFVLRYGSFKFPLDTGVDELTDHAPVQHPKVKAEPPHGG